MDAPEINGFLIDPKGGLTRSQESYAQELKKSLEEAGASCSMTPLQYGDVAFLGHGPDGPWSLGVEIKKVPDLLSSIRGGRLLEHQIPGLLQDYDRAWLLIEGVYRMSRRDGSLELPHGAKWKTPEFGVRRILWKDVETVLTKIEYQAGVSVIKTRSVSETAQRLITMKAYCQRAWDDHSPLIRLGASPPPRMEFRRRAPEERLIMDWLADLPGVGWERVSKVWTQLPSAAAIASLSVEDWRRVLGVKGKKAKLPERLYALIHKERHATEENSDVVAQRHLRDSGTADAPGEVLVDSRHQRRVSRGAGARAAQTARRRAVSP